VKGSYIAMLLLLTMMVGSIATADNLMLAKGFVATSKGSHDSCFDWGGVSIHGIDRSKMTNWVTIRLGILRHSPSDDLGVIYMGEYDSDTHYEAMCVWFQGDND
jgi:hypothetical protein